MKYAPRTLSILLASLVVLPLTGCLVGEPEIGEMVRALEEEVYPAQLDAKAAVKIGSGLLNLASVIVSWSDDHDLDSEQVRLLLKDLDAVHVGAYEVRGRRWADDPVKLSEEWRLQLEHEGWKVIVRVQDRFDETQWILVRTGGRHGIDGLYVVSVEDTEVVVVKLEGELSRSIDYAVRRDSDFMVAMREAGNEF